MEAVTCREVTVGSSMDKYSINLKSAKPVKPEKPVFTQSRMCRRLAVMYHRIRNGYSRILSPAVE